MKKVGEILREERLRQSKTLEEISKETKIRTEYLVALENSSYNQLPDPIYIRGFITSYAETLGVDHGHVLPFYRREFEQYNKKNDVRKIPIPLGMNRFKLTPSKVFIISASILITSFIIVLFWQYRNFAGVPVLSVSYPPNNLITTESTIEVTGQTDPKATVTLNGELVDVDITGSYKISYRLSDGLNRIKIIAESDLGKKNTLELIVEKEIVPNQ